MKAIFTRRSIRRYTDQPVSQEAVLQLLEAAMAAPSAGDSRPWHFVVITDRQLLDKVPSFHAYARMITEAPMAILVCGDQAQAKFDAAYWVQDCSAATQNILLAAEAMGLGSVWLGVYPLEERMAGLRDLLGIPEHITPFALLPVGHPGEEKPPAERYDADRVHYDRW